MIGYLFQFEISRKKYDTIKLNLEFEYIYQDENLKYVRFDSSKYIKIYINIEYFYKNIIIIYIEFKNNKNLIRLVNFTN